MTDYGAKVSRRGYDVNTASDRQLLWSSAFQSLKIVDRFDVSFTADNTERVLYTHNLGYRPMFYVYSGSGSVLWHMKRIVTNDTDFRWYPGRIPGNLPLNPNANAKVIIFDVEINTVFNAPNIDLSDDPPAPYGDFGIKVSRDGFDVKTATLEELAFSSGGTLAGQPVQLQLSHKYGYMTNVIGQNVQTIPHGLGYVPMFAVFVRYRRIGGSAGRYYNWIVPQWTEPISQQISNSWADANNIYFYDWAQGWNRRNDYAWFILKDPF